MQMKKRKTKAVAIVGGLDLQSNMSYEGVKDIYHAVGRTSRSASEAFKDADYASAFWKCETDFTAAMRFLKGMMEGMFTVFMMLFIPVLILIWLFR
jgi:hypothetical protein